VATIQIDTINTKSTGGYPVTISGLCPTDHDCIAGAIVTPGTSLTPARWNLSGIMRGGTDKCNLNMSADEMHDLGELAKRLGAS
jgi:hypothetical protein